MSSSTGTGKYEQLLERCRSLPPVPTAVVHPCEETALAGAIEAGAEGPHRADPRRPGEQDSGSRQKAGIELGSTHDRRRAAQPRRGGQGRGARAQGRGRAADERQPAHRRAPRRGGGAGDRASHRTPHQPRLHHGRADLSQGPHRDRCGHQHCAGARGQGRHLPERDRPGDHAWRRSSRRWRSSPRWRRSPRRWSRRSTRRRCARWPTAVRSPAALLDGPLAFDNAISREAARIKGITSEVAGDPDILLVPDLEAGNMLAKQLHASWPTPTAPASCSARACRSS